MNRQSEQEEREADSEIRAKRPRRLGNDEHGRYLRLNLWEALLAFIGFVSTFAALFAWTLSDIRDLRAEVQRLAVENAREQAEHQGVHQKVDMQLQRTQKLVEDWHRDQFSADCARDGGLYDYNGQYCDRAGRPTPYKPLLFD